MIKPLFSFLLLFLFANAAYAETKCFTERDINQIAKSNALTRKGELTLDAKTLDIAFLNRKTRRFFSVKQTGKCFFDPTFLTESQYEERYQFEGEGGEE